MRSTTISSQRLDYLDAAKGIFIIFILNMHHLMGADTVRRYLYSLGVTPFFLISGFLYARKREWEQPFARNFIRKLRKLMYPFFTFSVINLLWNVLYYKVVYPDAVPESGFPKMLIMTVTTYGYNALWYLPCVLWGTMLFFAIRRSRHHAGAFAALSIGVVVVFILLDEKLTGLGIVSYLYSYLFRVAVAAVFLYMGSWLYALVRKLDKARENILLLCCAVVSAVIAVLYWCFPAAFPVANLAAHRIGNPYIYYLASLSGTLLIVLLCKKCLYRSRALTYFGRNSLVLMALHMDVTTKIAWWIFPKLPIDLGETVNSMIVIGLELLMYPVIITILNRFFPFVLKYPATKKT